MPASIRVVCREFSEHKIAVCEKIAGLRSGNSSDLNSACLKVLVPVEIFQFSDMHYETERYRDSTDGLFVLMTGHRISYDIVFICHPVIALTKAQLCDNVIC